MPDLPPELFDIIFPFLVTRRDVWNVFHTCRFFRHSRVLTLILLQRYGFSKSQVLSGAVVAAEEYVFLLPMISGIWPITKLTVRRREPCVPLHWYGLPSVIQQLDHLTDLVILGRCQRDPGIAKILAVMSKNIHPLVFVGLGHSCVRVSEFNRLPPIGWKPLYPSPSDLRSLDFQPEEVLLLLLLAIPLVIVMILSWIWSVYKFAVWLCCHYFAFGAPWDQVHRISKPLRYGFGDRHNGIFRVQNIHPSGPGGSPFTIATFKSMRRLELPRLPSLSPTQYNALLTSMHASSRVTLLTVEEGCSLDLHALRRFIYRHKRLNLMRLDSGALASASLLTLSSGDVPSGRLQVLNTVPEYVPYVLPHEPHLTCLTILANQLTHGSHLSRALSSIAIARLHDPLTKLRLSLHLPGLIPPWRDTVYSDDEPRVGGFISLNLVISKIEYTSADKFGLPVWLAHCSALRNVGIPLTWIPQPERASLVDSINDKRRALGLNDLRIDFPPYYPGLD
ncbi:hypothetical protein R3P38DRAFT_2843835 [Favolaschia claudopus]|uniref:F-box domain-containing protein n=1 Tax=Favolaschia claudopus TaxID=2862362 RepID=A0AAW0E1D4_9AGAR